MMIRVVFHVNTELQKEIESEEDTSLASTVACNVAIDGCMHDQPFYPCGEFPETETSHFYE